MTFSNLSVYLEKLEKTASRNQITQILADLFGQISAGEIDKTCYLLLGRVAPQYAGTEFNFAEKMMLRAIGLAFGYETQDILKKYKTKGDLGDVAEEIARTKKQKNKRTEMSISKVYECLYQMATEGGGGSQERKLVQMADLLKSVDPLSARFLARIPAGKMRLGFSDMTILDALSVMETGSKGERKRIEAAFSVMADIGKIAQQVKEKGIQSMDKVQAEVGVPIRNSLAERLPSAVKVAEKLAPEFAIEPKMDGFRVQLHVWSHSAKASRDRFQENEKNVRIFSRNLENVTDMFPELVKAAKKLPFESVIFDGEAIGYNPKTGKFVPFQETVQRKRKYGIEEKSKELPLKIYVFDLLLLDGKMMLQEPFSKRRQALEEVLKKNSDTIVLTPQKIATTAREIKDFFEECISDGLEGVMAKKLDTPYQAGGRGFHWVKYKKHSEVGKNIDGLADTIDCILMGAYRGRGKRAKFGVGGFLLGIPGKDDKFYSLSNLGTGLTDEQFRKMYKSVQGLEVREQPKEYVVDKTVAPDIWVSPKMVLEILADEITLSPRHTAGKNHDGRGLSLRFPRLIKIREDKDPEQATTVGELEKLYKMQFK